MVNKHRIIRPVPITTSLPEDLRAKLDAYLYSPVEGRVPKGKYSEFFIARTREFFDNLQVSNDPKP